MLTDYFHPHSLQDLSLLVVLLMAWDITGFGVFRLLNIPILDFIRPVRWWLGLGLAVFVVFFWHFFYAYSGWFFVSFSLVAAVPFLSSYIKELNFKPFWVTYRWLLLLLLPLFPLLFVKSSLPPYQWDEAVYHYISPYVLNNEMVWHFRGLYSQLPRLLETAFISLFALTRTYATARLLHLAIYLSALASLYLFISSRLGRSWAVMAIAVVFYLLSHLLLGSTSGYIDTGTTSFILITWLLTMEFVSSKSQSALWSFPLFAGLAVGAKYNSLAPIAVSGFVLAVSRFRHGIRLSLSRFVVSAIFFLCLGGYWYVKNWAVTGNPLYPFFFSCRTGGCGQGQAFFDWAEPLTLTNLPTLLRYLFLDRPWFPGLLGALVFLGLVISRGRLRRFLSLSLMLIGLEFVFLSRVAGFTLRYFYHWQILLWLVFIISLVLVLGRLARQLPLFAGLALFSLTALTLLYFRLPQLAVDYYELLPRQDKHYQVRFALHKFPVSDYILRLLPNIGPGVLWCESQPEPKTLVVKDPDLHWSTGEAKFPIFFTRCHHREDFQPGQPKLLLSAQACPDPSQPPPIDPDDDDRMRAMRAENYYLICRADKIVPGLYAVTDQP